MATTITFNGLTLNPSLQWIDRYNWSNVAQNNIRTLGGTFVSFAMGTSGGRPITLQATENTGWFTKTMVDSLKSFADVPGATYALSFHGESHTVMFNHAEAPAVEFTRLVPREPPDADDPFAGTLKLIEV